MLLFSRRSLTLERSRLSLLHVHRRHFSSKDSPSLSRSRLDGLRQEEWKRFSGSIAVVPSVAFEASLASGKTSSGSGSNQFSEMMGISWIAFTAAVCLGLSLNHGSHSTTQTEGSRNDAVMEGAEIYNDPSASQRISTLATSALFMDPQMGMFYDPTNAILGSRLQQPVNKEEPEEDHDEDDGDGALIAGTYPKSASSTRFYDLSIRAVKGQRKYMEDTFFVAPEGRFVAVFDGHGGAQVSSYLRDALYTLAQQALRQKQWEIDHDMLTDATHGSVQQQQQRRRNMIPSIASHVAALRTAFMEAEKHVLNQSTWDKQGSTAVAVWVHESPESGSRTLVSANIGDSRAILSREGVAINLTRDHKPNEEREKSRIKQLGGTIEWDALAKVHRVESLSLSRAIGDAFAKPIVSSEVEIKLYPVMEGKDEFLLLASDGLWDVMTSQEVVTYVKERFRAELSRIELTSQEDIENCKLVVRRNMARSICREAIRRGTGDNVCVLMVWLDDGGKFTASHASQ